MSAEHEDKKLDDKELELQKLAYQWYTAYEQWAEFEYEPEWGDTMETRITHKDMGSYQLDVLLIRDKSMGKGSWIKSDKHYDLNQMT